VWTIGGIDDPGEVLDVGRDPRWRPAPRVLFGLALIAGALAATLSYVLTRPGHPSPHAAPAAAGASASSTAPHSGPPSPSTSPAGLTRIAGDCLATRALASTRPPGVLHYSAPPPVPWVRDWYGNGSLWVMLPPDSQLPTDPHADGSVTTKFPFFRVAHGQVHVQAQRLDGPGGQFSAAVGNIDAYGTSGFVPTELRFSTSGCWRLRAVVSGGPALTFTLLVKPPIVSRSELTRPLRLPTLRPGQSCPVSGGTPITTRGTIGFAGVAQGRGPVRPLVGNRHGVAHLTRTTAGPGWLAAKTLWFSDPRYQGPYLIRVRRLDGTGPVGLLENPRRTSFLLQQGPTINEADGYRETPGGTWMQQPGCIGWQIDGLDFSRVIVVRFTR
jgi:hypothetical protein